MNTLKQSIFYITLALCIYAIAVQVERTAHWRAYEECVAWHEPEVCREVLP